MTGTSAYPNLTGKVVLITGASRGIGAATARAFAQAGAAVVLAARDADALAAVAQEVRSLGGEALSVPTDVGEPAAVEHLVQWTLDTYGRLDAAFNNAGTTFPPTPLADLPVETFDQVMRVNLHGVFLAMKYEIPAMLAHDGGAIVNMSATAGLLGVPGFAPYVASKHGVIGLTETAALDYAAHNLRINAIAPGPIHTHHLERAGERAREHVAQSVPVRRLGQPEEVAAMVVWLCSDQASFVTGATITIDGGRMAGGA
jgi:NAD(P)-dependent dehydrogenase (short-subunit alcohol dehydrogenase family)